METYKCLTVKQPYADLLTRAVWQDETGIFHAAKTIEVRSRDTRYRGEVLITSSAKPVLFGHESGVVCGIVELYDTKRVEDFTEEDWRQTCIPEKERPATGWGWLMRDPMRVVEFPVKGQLGLYDRTFEDGEVFTYPRYMRIGEDGWHMIQERIKNAPCPL